MLKPLSFKSQILKLLFWQNTDEMLSFTIAMCMWMHSQIHTLMQCLINAIISFLLIKPCLGNPDLYDLQWFMGWVINSCL